MPNTDEGRAKRGFAAMDPAKQREIARQGGRKSGGNFANDRQRAAIAGRQGGKASRSTRPETAA